MSLFSRRLRAMSLALVVMVVLAGMPLYAQRSQEGFVSTEGADTAVAAAPVEEVMEWSDKLPELTDEQKAQLDYNSDRVNLPGPARDLAAAGTDDGLTLDAAPAPESATTLVEDATADKAPQAPGDAQIYRSSYFGSILPSGYKSNVLEPSLGVGGKYAFYSGNWFAARSTNGGSSWSYVNAYTNMSDFCCDQIVQYDKARDMFLWLRQGVANASGVNRFRLGASTNGGSSFCAYDFYPTNTNAGWTNQWWDYPHIQLSADYAYITFNLFNAASSWTRTALLRLPLDSLRSCSGFSYSYTSSTSWFTFVPVQGADHVMYFASNNPTSSPYNRISIWRWAENNNNLVQFINTVAAWTYGSNHQCGSSSGNWMGRSSDRLLAGARYELHYANLNVNGRKVLGWWWNAQQGGNFTQPYIDGYAIYEDTMTQVSGNQGRPYIWSSSHCYGYPSVAANARGDLGIVMDYAQSSDSWKPRVGYIIADDFVNAPPGFSFNSVVASNARPSDNKWGDYNTVRVFQPGQNNWVAGAHYIPGSTNCSVCSAPVYFAFGRSRDYYNWSRWAGY